MNEKQNLKAQTINALNLTMNRLEDFQNLPHTANEVRKLHQFYDTLESVKIEISDFVVHG